jgi:hypothetical protein
MINIKRIEIIEYLKLMAAIIFHTRSTGNT